MVDFRPVIHILGWLAGIMASIMCLPALIDLVYGANEWKTFFLAAFIAGFFAVIGIFPTRKEEGFDLNIRQAFLITTLGWIVVAALGAIPFLSSGIDYTAAVFESMSAITTTGATVLDHLDERPPGILMWRAMLQWIGGIGIIAIAILILPLLRVGGMQIFRIESSDTYETRIFTVIRTVVFLITIYVVLTLCCGLLFWIFGMSGFDAFTHAMTTVSTGGFSTHDASFGWFDDLALHWIAILFMICGAIPFYLYIKAVRGNVGSIFKDQQVQAFLLFLLGCSLFMAIWLMMRRDVDFFHAITLTAFNIVSVVTTTGFASDDYTAWGNGAIGLFLVLTFVGGCSGSTSGAIKIYRYQLLFIIVRAHVKRLISPNRIVPLRYNHKALPEDVALSVLVFLAVFLATIALFTAVLTLMDLDFLTAWSASVTAITNVGPGLGDIIGPAGNFAPLPDAAKWVLVVAMLAGRLEVIALLVAFDPDFWR